MNGTSIDSLRYMNPNQQFIGMQTNDILEEQPRVSERDIDMIARDVNDSLDDTPQEQHHSEKSKHSKNKDKKTEKNDAKKETFMSKIPEILREPLIIVFIYIILSTNIVKKTLSSYIPQIRPTTDGNILFVGIFVYALIMAICFIVIKKLLM
jgi:magnesium-transporting ATPase (P-type)